MACDRRDNQLAEFNLDYYQILGVAKNASESEIKKAYRAVYGRLANRREAAAAALSSGGFETAAARRFLEFFSSGTRGFVRCRQEAASEERGE